MIPITDQRKHCFYANKTVRHPANIHMHKYHTMWQKICRISGCGKRQNKNKRNHIVMTKSGLIYVRTIQHDNQFILKTFNHLNSRMLSTDTQYHSLNRLCACLWYALHDRTPAVSSRASFSFSFPPHLRLIHHRIEVLFTHTRRSQFFFALCSWESV